MTNFSAKRSIRPDHMIWRLQTVEKVLEVPPKEVYAHEFSVYAALEFTLFLPLWEIMPHLERIVDASSELNDADPISYS